MTLRLWPGAQRGSWAGLPGKGHPAMTVAPGRAGCSALAAKNTA
jgi:hypothetical protein